MTLAKGWEPGGRTVALLTFLVGVALVVNPVAVWVFDLGGDRYHYQSTAVTLDGEHARVADGSLTPEPRAGGVLVDLPGIDCHDRTSRSCLLEASLREREAVAVPSTSVSRGAPFVSFGGTYYRRVVEEREDATYLSLEPTTEAAFVRETARPVDELASVRSLEPVVEATRTDRASSDDDALREHSGLLVESDGRYRLVYETGVDRGMAPWLRAVLSYTGLVAGVVVLTRGPGSPTRG